MNTKLVLCTILLATLTMGGRLSQPSGCRPEPVPGTLYVNSDPASPASQQWAMGDDATVFSFILEASPEEDLEVKEIPLKMNCFEDDCIASVQYFQLIDDAGVEIGPTVLNLNPDGQVFFPFSNGELIIPAGGSVRLALQLHVASYPDAVEAGEFQFSFMGSSSPVAIGMETESEIYGSYYDDLNPPMGNFMGIYRSIPKIELAETSPFGTQIGGFDQEVLRINISQHSNWVIPTLGLHAIAFDVKGSVNVEGDGSVALYDVLNPTPLLRREAKTIVFKDMDGIDRGNEISFEMGEGCTCVEGIPLGSGVQIFRDGNRLGGIWTVSGLSSDMIYLQDENGNSPTFDLDDGDLLVYRPLQTGGHLLFAGGGLISYLSSGSKSLWISGDGIAIGDILYPRGFSLEGESVERVAGCQVTSVSSGAVNMTPCYVTRDLTIVSGIATTQPGYLADFFGDESITLSVRGDTTGAKSGDSLQLVLTETGFIWSDGVIPLTPDIIFNGDQAFPQSLPLEGGVLLY